MLKTEELYKLVKSSLKQLKFIYDEDILQDIVTNISFKLDSYDESKGSISNFIYHITKNEYLVIKKKEKALKRIPEKSIVSLSTPVSKDDDKITLMDLIPNDDLTYQDKLNRQAILEEIIPLVEEPLRLWLTGKTQTEICNILGFKYQGLVSIAVNKNLNDIKEYCKRRNLKYNGTSNS